jgi:hypothetical protein
MSRASKWLLSFSDESSLRDDPTLGHFDLVHTARREDELHKDVGGFSETWRTMLPTASVSAACKTTEPTRMPARFTRTC